MSETRINLELAKSDGISRLVLWSWVSYVLVTMAGFLEAALYSFVFVENVVIASGPDSIVSVRRHRVPQLAIIVIRNTIVGFAGLYLVFCFSARLYSNGREHLRGSQLLVLLYSISSLIFLVFPTTVFNEDGQINEVSDILNYFLLPELGKLCFFFYAWSLLDICASNEKLTGRDYYGKISFCVSFGLFRALVTRFGLVGTNPYPILSYLTVPQVLAKVPVSDWTGWVIALLFWQEVGMITWIFYLVGSTGKKLSALEYGPTRTRQLGYRYFRHYLFTTLVSGGLLLAFQEGFNTNADRFLFHRIDGVLALGYHDNIIDIRLIMWIFIFTQVYAYLPANTAHFPAWFRSDNDTTSRRNIEYVRQEEEVQSFCCTRAEFNVESCVSMLNFSWWVYHHSKEIEKDAELLRFKEFEVYDKETDTLALIFEADNKIVVCFRGTQSKLNQKTDTDVATVPFHEFRRRITGQESTENSMFEELISRVVGVVPNDIRTVISTASQANVHKGFATAVGKVYQELLDLVKKLFKENERPIFVCGHSLGGALALLWSTLAVIDWPEIKTSITVYSFGSPRIGNQHWSRLCRSIILRHWRVTISGDPIPKLPGWPYVDCETHVLITEDLNLIVDPSLLENLTMRIRRARLIRHKLASYSFALRLWTNRHMETESVSAWSCFDSLVPPKVRRDFKARIGREADEQK